MASVIFDLDGTLVDSAPDIHACVNAMLAAMGEPPLTLAVVTGFIGGGVPTLIDRVLRASGHDADPARKSRWQAAFMRLYDRNDSGLSRLYPGVAAALRDLAAQGHALGLCTNKPERPARKVLQAFGLTALFPVVIGGDSLARRKPDPAPLRAVAAALPPGPVVYVGDSEVDAATAAAAAVPFLLFTEGYRKSPAADIAATARFARFADLPGLVGDIAG